LTLSISMLLFGKSQGGVDTKKNNLYLVDFLARCSGNNTLFHSTPYGKLVLLDSQWTYVIGTEKRDLHALLNLSVEEHQKRDLLTSANGSVAIEAANICECLEILLAFIQKGYIHQENGIPGCKIFITKKVLESEPVIKGVDFSNWPIRITTVTEFPHCDLLTRRAKGIITCGKKMNTECIESCLCPLVYRNKTLNDGKCLLSLYTFGGISLSKHETQLNGLTFPLRKVCYRP